MGGVREKICVDYRFNAINVYITNRTVRQQLQFVYIVANHNMLIRTKLEKSSFKAVLNTLSKCHKFQLQKLNLRSDYVLGKYGKC